MKYKFIKSPNFSDRKDGAIIDTIVLHHTTVTDMQAVLNIFTNPELIVSSHYLVDVDGTIVQLVDDEKKARHAGVSFWRGREEINEYSIGIELVNSGFEPFEDAQIQATIELCKDLKTRHNIIERNIVAHADIAPNRKVDPSKYFNWKLLNENGIGLYSTKTPNEIKTLHRFGDYGKAIWELRNKLYAFGYGIATDEQRYDSKLENTINAFKRRYCPETYETSGWDTLAEVRIEDIMLQS